MLLNAPCALRYETMAFARDGPINGTVSSWAAVAVLRLTGFDVVAVFFDFDFECFFDALDAADKDVLAAAAAVFDAEDISDDTSAGCAAGARDELLAAGALLLGETAAEAYSATAETSVSP